MTNPDSLSFTEPREFFSALRASQDFMEIPRSFYKYWKDKIGSTFILEDDIGNIFNVSLNVQDGKAFFVDSIFAIRQHYLIPSGAVVWFKYLGRDKFKFKVSMGTKWDEKETVYGRQTNLQLLPGSSSNVGENRANFEILWTNKITEALSTGKQALAVAGNIAEIYLKGKQNFYVRVEDGNLQTWSLIWTSAGQCRIGRGWYQYCRVVKPKKDDVLQFLKSEDERENCFHVKLIRN